MFSSGESKETPVLPRPVVIPPEAAGHELPATCAWVARADVDIEGRETSSPDRFALAIVAVSINEQFPQEIPWRTWLLQRVISLWSPSLPTGVPSLWVFPAGYYEYDPIKNGWWNCDERAVEESLRPVIERLPEASTLAIGVDSSGSNQQAWVYTRGTGRAATRRTITRGDCDLPERVVRVGPFAASFFVCGEMLGNPSQGAYSGRKYLESPFRQLPDVQVLVDLSHRRVPKGTAPDVTNPRWAHDSRIRRFATRGVAVLAHHHAGGTRFNCQSNWIICRAETPRYTTRVMPITAAELNVTDTH